MSSKVRHVHPMNHGRLSCLGISGGIRKISGGPRSVARFSIELAVTARPQGYPDVTQMLACVDGVVQDVPLFPEVESVPLERATPIREFSSWPGKRNYEGLYWSSANRRHVDFESKPRPRFLRPACQRRRPAFAIPPRLAANSRQKVSTPSLKSSLQTVHPSANEAVRRS